MYRKCTVKFFWGIEGVWDDPYFFAKQTKKGTDMTLTTDIQIKKWKPRSDKGERASCGHGLYIQGFSNGTRAWIYRLLISVGGGKQKTVWLKIGYPAPDTEHGVAGGPLRLHEARELSVRIGSIVKRGKASAAQIKNALEITCPIHEFEDVVVKPFLSPEVDFSKIPTFDEMFKQWYDLQKKSKRWTPRAWQNHQGFALLSRRVFWFCVRLGDQWRQPLPSKKEIHQATTQGRTSWNDPCQPPPRTLPIRDGWQKRRDL